MEEKSWCLEQLAKFLQQTLMADGRNFLSIILTADTDFVEQYLQLVFLTVTPVYRLEIWILVLNVMFCKASVWFSFLILTHTEIKCCLTDPQMNFHSHLFLTEICFPKFHWSIFLQLLQNSTAWEIQIHSHNTVIYCQLKPIQLSDISVKH